MTKVSGEEMVLTVWTPMKLRILVFGHFFNSILFTLQAHPGELEGL